MDAVQEVPPDSVVGLDLSRRGLTSLAPWLGGQAALLSLETLDASRNELPALRGLGALPRLRVLNLFFNRVGTLRELLRLRASARSLRVLDLRLNPVARVEGYRRCVGGDSPRRSAAARRGARRARRRSHTRPAPHRPPAGSRCRSFRR